jgi:hypothetical protein
MLSIAMLSQLYVIYINSEMSIGIFSFTQQSCEEQTHLVINTKDLALFNPNFLLKILISSVCS